MINYNTPEILSQSEVNEIAHTLDIMAESGKFEVVGSAEIVGHYAEDNNTPIYVGEKLTPGIGEGKTIEEL